MFVSKLKKFVLYVYRFLKWLNFIFNKPGNIAGKVGLQVGGADVSNINPMFDVTPAFNAQTTITRSSTVTSYTAGQLVLGNGATVLPTIDLSAATGLNLANRRIAITGGFLVSSNGANSAFNGFIDFFNVNNLACGTNIADYVTFNPMALALASNFVSTLDSMSNSRKYGTTSNLTLQSEILRKCTLDANGRLYFAPVVGSSGYTSANGETLILVLKFYLLN